MKILILPRYSSQWLNSRCRFYNYIPFFIEKLLLFRHNYSFDFDDYVAVDYQKNMILNLFLRNKINYLFKGAKFGTVENHWCFSVLKDSNLYYLPTVVDINRYKKIDTNSNKVAIVWISSHNTQTHLNLLELIAYLFKFIPGQNFFTDIMLLGFLGIILASFTNPYLESFSFQWMFFFPLIYFFNYYEGDISK